MGSLNIAEWSPDQVADWLTGLGPKVAQYVPELQKKNLNGSKLLILRCDDLEYLGVHIIGHQELILEAVEQLRNFHYEASRECVQQLAVRVSGAAASLARALHHRGDARLETAALADVARTVHAVKPLVCWLDRWPLCPGSPLAARKTALLQLSLEAATCAQRERFAEQPARAVAAAAAALAALADYIIQDVSDPMILQPARVDAVTLAQGERALGFEVVPSFCGQHRLAHIRFASPAHASGLVHEADEIVQVGARCVLGWPGDAVEEACAGAARGGELALRLRRRGARALPAPPSFAPRVRRPRPPQALRALHRYMLDFPLSGAVSPAPRSVERPPRAHSPSSDDSDALSPPASPTLIPDTARMYPPKPRPSVVRRHSVSGDSPAAVSHAIVVHQLWQQLQQQRLESVDGDSALYRRDKAVSCSTGLQLSPRPRTCIGVQRPLGGQLNGQVCTDAPNTPARGKLDKSHSTPAYDFEPGAGPAAHEQTIPESPTTPIGDAPTLPEMEKAGQILDFKQSSSRIEEAIQQRNRRAIVEDEKTDIFTDEDIKLIDEDTKFEIVETVNTVFSKIVNVGELSDTSKSSPDEVTEGDGEERLPAPIKYPKPRITERFRPADLPPEPPPRPAFTQRRHINPPPPPPRDGRDSLIREHSFREAVRDILPRENAPIVPRDPPVSYPALRMLPRTSELREISPLKPIRAGDAMQISVPLRHITKHDIKLIAQERREPPAINGEMEALSPAPLPAVAAARREELRGDIVIGAASDSHLDGPGRAALSPSAGGVRGIFPSSKSRSLKKKNSILAKRREVPARSLAARGAAGRVWQRVRGRGRGATRWAPRHLLLAHNLLYAYRSPECARAACMIYLEGFTVCAAVEVKSRAHAFKVYHTGTAFYFACDSRDAMLAWIHLVHRATLLPSLLASAMDLSKQFSETDYSETESDTESSEKRIEKEREKEREKDREKEKSKFGSLKKLTNRASRSESQESVGAAAASLDRKYLRFFSRARAKEEPKSNKKPSGVPVPTEHYRSYRRADLPSPRSPAVPSPAPTPCPASCPSPGSRPAPSPGSRPAPSPGSRPAPGPGPSPATSPAPRSPAAGKKLPKPINYIHASNPNLLDFEKSDFVTKPSIQVPKPKAHKSDNFVGFVTLEEFMLKKQEEERQQVYTNRVLMGVERDRKDSKAKELQKRLDRIVPDVIYGEVCGDKAEHGYETLVFPDERDGCRDTTHSSPAHSSPPSTESVVSSGAGVSRLRLMFGGARRDIVRQESSRSEQYAHLQCPPTFQPETYSLSRPPRDAHTHARSHAHAHIRD